MLFRCSGSGDVAGVPVFGCNCPACARARRDPRHCRGPASAEIDSDHGRYLIDAGRHDLIQSCEQRRPRAILLTHYHADHVQGLLTLRWGVGESIPVFGPRDERGFDDLYKHPGILDFRPPLRAFEPCDIGGLTVMPVPLAHSRPTFGYCLQGVRRRVAYLTDTVGLPAETERFLRAFRPDLALIDATYLDGQDAGSNHNHLGQALALLAAIGTRQGVLTHLGHRLDCAALEGRLELPQGRWLAEDGQTWEI
ncbi:phosphonate metabolism protein PhnP [Halotalea alkalilenta]|uniref:Phosphonate metabolism protein PhnP n=1 Tax=Halotalea alkalilenta TaxID=376489 RepID=A0A172YE30_9GAMM|nr:phosphonate metabolism protein PhnP [Halotalea alkalilenta]ANF57366.1 phosphonate metabolism protein PhnP [Halotalea alkalilenta]